MVSILVVLTFAVVIGLVFVVQSLRQRREMAESGPLKGTSLALSLPPSYRLSPGHIWIRELTSGDVRVGLDELVQRFVGRPDRVELKKVGDIVSRGEPLAVVGAGGKKLLVKSPVNGQVAIVNEDISTELDSLNDPYGAGWFYVLKPLYSQTELGNTRIGDEAIRWLTTEFNRLRDFVHGSARTDYLVGQTMADGGMPVSGMINSLDQDAISRFEDEFLTADKS